MQGRYNTNEPRVSYPLPFPFFRSSTRQSLPVIWALKFFFSGTFPIFSFHAYPLRAKSCTSTTSEMWGSKRGRDGLTGRASFLLSSFNIFYATRPICDRLDTPLINKTSLANSAILFEMHNGKQKQSSLAETSVPLRINLRSPERIAGGSMQDFTITTCLVGQHKYQRPSRTPPTYTRSALLVER